jgi:DeoR/GlpR family transcriptional regulator of sugar metabolism
MLAAQRRARVLEDVRDRGGASLRDIADRLGVSLSTARRDVDYLTRSGHLARTRGGVLSTPHLTTFEPDRDIAAATAAAAKDRIGAWAARRIEPNQSVIFDSGTTVMAAARAALARGIAFTAVTNDLAIAQLLARGPVRVVVIGGTLRAGSVTMLGPPGHGLLEGLNADLALIGAHAVGEAAFSDTSLELAEQKRRLMRAGKARLLLADAGKFAASAFADIAPLTELTEIVTDRPPPPGRAAAWTRAGVSVRLAPGADGA